MLPVLISSLLSLAALRVDSWIVFVFLLSLTISYLRKGERLNVGSENYANFLFVASLLAALSFTLPKPLVFCAIFTSLAHEFKKGLFRNLAIYSFMGFIYLFVYYNFSYSAISQIMFISISGGIAAALVESVNAKVDKRVTVLLALATAYAIFTLYIPDASLYDLSYALAISLVLSYLAMRTGVADESGLLAATLSGLIVILFTDIRFFIVLLFFYAFGSAITKYKYEVKKALGIAEQAGGARGYANVLGNSLPALFFAMNYPLDFKFAAAFVASVAAALADTMASEVGKTAKKVYLITNFKLVKPGESGGISLIGELAALAGSVTTALIAFLLGVVEMQYLLHVVLASFLGVHVDSILGATLEKAGYLTNSTVNLLAALSAGIVCYLLLLF
ncbi:MAG: TIGR00297 family protein [Archaeoglobaceae archaeon]